VIVQVAGGGSVELGPCPDWCRGGHGLGEDVPVNAGDGFHHVGPGASVTVEWRAKLDGPPDTVNMQLEAFTAPLDADPGPARIELELKTTDGEAYTELTSAEARAVAASLLRLADVAQRAGQAQGA
jgi:hypothetical protein